MISRIARILQTVVLTLLLGFCAFIIGALLYHKAKPLDAVLHQQITGAIGQLSALDARWDEDVLKSRLSLNSNYDPLIASQTQLSRLSEQLNQDVTRVAGRDAVVMQHLAQFRTALTDKVEQIEYFKSQNSILRNSVDFISTGLRNLLDALENNRASTKAVAPALASLQHRVQAILTGFVEYSTKPQADTAAFIRYEIEGIEEILAKLPAGEALPDAVDRHLAIALNHIQTILSNKPAVDNLLGAIAAIPTSANLEQLALAYQRLYDQRQQASEQYRSWFYGYVALMAIVVAIGFMRLRNHQRMQFLRQMTKTLEQRVNQRTTDLSKAMDELKASQARLVQSEKMTALGQMVAGVVHEINTPLAYSRSNVALVQEQLPEVNKLIADAAQQAKLLNDPEVDEMTRSEQLNAVAELAHALHEYDVVGEMFELLGASLSGLDQIADMISSLKDFSRVDRKKIEQINLNAGLDKALLIAKNMLKHKVEIVKRYGDIPNVTCAPSQINQVFLNMLINASQAIEDKGTITLTTMAKGEHVEVEIADSGKGIPADVLPRIFDPFFTTKKVGEGTGLGLAICYQIIEQHNGTIKVDSQPGRGARFTIVLPVKQPQTPAIAPSELNEAA